MHLQRMCKQFASLPRLNHARLRGKTVPIRPIVQSDCASCRCIYDIIFQEKQYDQTNE